MFFKRQTSKQKIVIAIVLSLFLITQVFGGVFLFAKPAGATVPVADMGPLAATEAAEEVKEEVKEAVETTYDKLKAQWWVVLMEAGFSAANYFLQKLTYDFAVWMASGFQGQRPMIFTEQWGTYLTNLALGAAGDFIGSLSAEWQIGEEDLGYCEGTDPPKTCGKCDEIEDEEEKAKCVPENECPVVEIKKLGAKETVQEKGRCIKATRSFKYNLCAPQLPELRLHTMLSLGKEVQPPTPKCEWQNIVKQWEAVFNEATSPEVLNLVSVQFSPGGGSDLWAAFEMQAKISEEISTKREGSTKEREEGEGFKGLTELITGEIKTPAGIIKAEATKQLSGKEVSEKEVEQVMDTALSPGALAEANAIYLGKSLLSTFVGTLSTKLYEMVLRKGIVTAENLVGVIAGLWAEDVLGSPEFAGLGGRRAAEATYADFITPRVREVAGYSPMIELAACPQGAQKQPENCAVDGQFVHAVNQAAMGDPLTVRQAIDKGFLNGNWPLIPPGDPRNDTRPDCYQLGYCYSNLVKLRKARVIPIGWEIAASLAAERPGTTLREVVNKFDECNAQGQADADHPWCHLIDPNWVLKSPAFQCRARVFGAVGQEGMRFETCVDAPSCLSEDNQGNCEVGWGYCTKEKNIWRITGDKCDAQFEGCRALRRRDGQPFSYLINTVDHGPPCTPDDVGCRWYSTRQAKVGDEWGWQDRTSGALKFDRIYFNKNVTQCTEEGCTQFKKTTRETSLNLVQNSSFENFEGDIDDGRNDKFLEWTSPRIAREAPPTPLPTVEAVSDTFAYHGRVAALLKTGQPIAQVINLGKPRMGRVFVLSFYAKDKSATEQCTGGVNFELDSRTFSALLGARSLSEWQRIEFRRSPMDRPTVHPFVNEFGFAISGNNCLIDAVQIEEVQEATPYHEGWAGVGEDLNLKKAPDYYNCYNYNPDGTVKTADDAETCTNFAKPCQENEVGCDRFTPLTTPGPPIPAIATYPDDYCPAECAGYQTFKQLKTNFEQPKFPVFFIPQTARACSAVEAGCDEFTNLATEEIENYSYLRQCQKPAADSETFYTWEGSDTAGYQLKTWSLKKRGNSTDSRVVDSDPDGSIENAPCVRAVYVGGDLQCQDHLIITEAEAREAGFCTKAETLEINPDGTFNFNYDPDCREFYDRDGKRHYRLYSKTIVSTDDCHPYRKTLSTQTDCERSGGQWSDVRKDCIYEHYPTESRRCGAVGCRAYRGNFGANVMSVFRSDFETWPDNWTVTGSGSGQSTEALASGGHSMKIVAGGTASKPVGGQIRKDGIYLISFWARAGAAGGSAEVRFERGTESITTPHPRPMSTLSTLLSLTWQQFTLGPIQVTWTPDRDNPTTPPATVEPSELLQITARNALAYFDNVELREVTDRIYLIKDSWRTPASCDQSMWGGHLPQAMLGCAEYRDSTNRQHFLKSFTNLCREEAVGCQKLIDTKNTDSPYEQTFNAECKLTTACAGATPCDCNVGGVKVCSVPRGQTSCRYDTSYAPLANILEDTVVLPPDSYAFLIVDQAKTCSPSNLGCTAYGSPKLDSSGSIICTLPDGPDAGTDPDICPAICNIDTGRFGTSCGSAAGCECKIGGQVMCTIAQNQSSCVPLGCDCKRDGEVMCKVLPGQTSCTGGFDSVLFLNDETRYSGPNRILCQKEYQSCEEYVGTGQAKFYFRDPGKRTCVWKENISYLGELRTGWFRKDDLGQDTPCYPDYTSAGVFGIWKNADIKCTLPARCDSAAGCSCTLGTASCTVPFGQKTCPYANWVGICPAEQDLCTKFLDPAATSGENPQGEPYYYIKNDKLMGKAGDCKGQVSLMESCVLFDDTSNLNKTYNAQATYAASEAGEGGVQKGGLVNPMNCQGSPRGEYCGVCGMVTLDVTPRYCSSDADCQHGVTCNPITSNNSNLILKVRRDRICAEWLACKTSTPTWDSFANRTREICEGLDLCDKYIKAGQTAECTNWIGDQEKPQILDLKTYTSRDTTWKGRDYSGYSIPNQFQTFKLSQINVAGIGQEAKWRLAFVEPNFCFGSPPSPPGYERLSASPVTDRTCGTGEEKGTCYAQNGVECRVDETVGGVRIVRTGKCWNLKCAYDPEGKPGDDFGPLGSFAEAKSLEVAQTAFAPACRAYPENNSPFPWTVAYAGETPDRKYGFFNAQVCEKYSVCEKNPGKICTDNAACGDAGPCEPASAFACECGYRKISYAGQVKYYGRTITNAPEAICVGGSKDKVGKPCSLDKCPGTDCECGSQDQAGSGTCTAKQKVDTVLGLEGYCLERDKTTNINGDPEQFACLTWLPVDRLLGAPDIYNQYVDAGYRPREKGQMCLQADLFVRPRPMWGCVEIDDWDMDCEFDDQPNGSTGGNCPTGWIYFRGGQTPFTNDGERCGVTGYDNCIYYCLPPPPWGKLDVNSGRVTPLVTPGNLEAFAATGHLEDLGLTGGPTEFFHACLPYFESRYGLGEDRGFHSKAQRTGEMWKRNQMEKFLNECTGDYLITAKEWEDLRVRGWGRLPGFYVPACSLVVKIGPNENQSKAWTNRLYQASGYRVKSDVLGSGNISQLNYMHQSKESPFGYAALPPSSGNPLAVPFCKEPMNIVMRQADPLAQDMKCAMPEAEITGADSNFGRPYMRFVYQYRQSCDSHEGCNPGARCETIQCYKKCETTLDCPLLPGCTVTEAMREAARAAGEDERLICRDACVDVPRDLADRIAGARGPLKACAMSLAIDPTPSPPETSCTPATGTYLSTSPCENSLTGPLGVCAGECTNVGRRCSKDEDCYAIKCRCNEHEDLALCRAREKATYCGGVETEISGVLGEHETIGQRDRGMTRLQQLFAESYGYWKWISKDLDARPADLTARGGYSDPGLPDNPITDIAELGAASRKWNITEVGDGVKRPRPPTVVPIGRCVDARCSPLFEGGRPVPGITVNEKSSGNVISRTGMLKAMIKFFAWPDPDQMPIKRVCIDFGNGTKSAGCYGPPEQNFYKAAHGWNPDGTKRCDGTVFSKSSQACQTDFYQGSTTYTCPALGAGMTPCNFDDPDPGRRITSNCYARTCPDPTAASCCVFRPRVQVLDNWGWCNGRCPGPPGGTGDGCYDGSQLTPPKANECETGLPSALEPNKNPWTPFAGRVIVVPR